MRRAGILAAVAVLIALAAPAAAQQKDIVDTAVAAGNLVDKLEVVRQPWSINGLAIQVTTAALNDTQFIENTKVTIAKNILKNRSGARYLAADNRRENRLQAIRPIPDSSHTSGVGAANRMFSIGKIWRREKRTASKLLIEAESFTPAGNSI